MFTFFKPINLKERIMLFTPFTFQNGKPAKNRIFKSAMEEQLSQNDQPSEKLVRLYDTWAKGGAGVWVTGNVMVAESGKGSINDVVISDDRSLEMLKNGRKPARKTIRCLSCKSTMLASSRLRWSIKRHLRRAPCRWWVWTALSICRVN